MVNSGIPLNSEFLFNFEFCSLSLHFEFCILYSDSLLTLSPRAFQTLDSEFFFPHSPLVGIIEFWILDSVSSSLFSSPRSARPLWILNSEFCLILSGWPCSISEFWILNSSFHQNTLSEPQVELCSLISGSLNSRCKSLARGQGSGFWILNSVLTCVLGQRVVGQCSEFWILNSVLTYMPCQRSRVIEQSSEFWILNSVLMYMPGQRWVGAPLNSEFWILSWRICRVKDGWAALL